MPKMLYRLVSGKLARVENGVNTIHRAPFDFVPSPSEFEANQFRLRAIGWQRDADEEPSAEHVKNDTALNQLVQIMETALQGMPESEIGRRMTGFREAIVTALHVEPVLSPAAVIDRKITAESEPPATIPANTPKKDVLTTLSQTQAATYIAVVSEVSELDSLLLEETGGRNRAKVIALIEKRRDEIVAAAGVAQA